LPLVLPLVLPLALPVMRAEAQSIQRDALPPELAQLTDEEVARIARMSPLPSVPGDPSNRFADDERAARFGHRLFFDRQISPAAVSCADCHVPAKWFTDGKPLGDAIGTSPRNTPTVIDSARRRWVGWDGKFDSLWSQALAPIEHPLEMGSSRERLLRTVRDDAKLRGLYEAVFGAWPEALTVKEHDPLAGATERGAAVDAKTASAADPALRTMIDAATANVLKALGAYQRRLVSGEAPIDRAVAALKAAKPVDAADLDGSALRGLALFVSRAGCFQCHRGASFTDEEFHNLGFAGANGKVPDDPARLAAVDFLKASPWNAAGAHSDAPDAPKGQMVRALRRSGDLFGQFRTPALRGVAMTPPYMHDGRLATIADVVRFYDTLEGASPIGHHGEQVLVPLGLTEQERGDLERFLSSLTGKEPNPEWTRDPAGDPSRTADPEGR
ncbi:MAG: cytochrome-c peroxidase, partial [bacterium]